MMNVETMELLDFLYKYERISLSANRGCYEWDPRRSGKAWKNISDGEKIGRIMVGTEEKNRVNVFDGKHCLIDATLILEAFAREASQEETRRDYIVSGEKTRIILRDKQDESIYSDILLRRRIPLGDSSVEEAFRFYTNKVRELEDKDSVWDRISRSEIELRYFEKNGNVFDEIDEARLSVRLFDLHSIDIDYWEEFCGMFPTDKEFNIFARSILSLDKKANYFDGRVYSEDLAKHLIKHNEAFIKRKVMLYRETMHYAEHVLKALKVYYFTPFLMKLFEDKYCGRIDIGNIEDILRVLEIYAFRKKICGQHVNSNVFTRNILKKRGKWTQRRTVRYIKRLRNNNRMPSDEVFSGCFQNANMYEASHKKYWLVELENHMGKHRIVHEGLTVEHVLPQTISNEWEAELGEEWETKHKKYLHKAGNLTLIKEENNFSIGNSSFEIKKPVLSRDKLHVNEMFKDYETWNDESIISRGKYLAGVAVKTWSFK